MKKEIIKNIYRTAPDKIKEAISSDDLAIKLDDLSIKNNLSNTQKNTLGNETTLRILGITKKTDLPSKIAKELAISVELGLTISVSIEELINSQITEETARNQEEYIQAKLAQGDMGFQTILESGVKENSLMPTVVTEKLNELPMVVTGEKPFDSAQSRPKTALSFEERKRLVPNIPDNKVHYEGGVDPYREQF